MQSSLAIEQPELAVLPARYQEYRAWRNRDTGLRRPLTDRLIAPYRSDPRLFAFCCAIGGFCRAIGSPTSAEGLLEPATR